MDQDILKSPNDKNLYKALVLDNGLKVLLVQTHIDPDDSNLEGDEPSDVDASTDNETTDADVTSDDDEQDPETDKKSSSSKKTRMAAAALSVEVGGFNDPPEVPGLAHFVEHMLFMGSEKYPEENAYDSFIQKHGGSDNAWTDCENTLCIMDVTPKYFKDALDIFAHCFISPLLKPDSVDREIEAIDSEFQLSVASDSERVDIIIRGTAQPGHPMTNFIWGNKITLKDDISENNIDLDAALRKFQSENYSADRMTLAVQSTETLETLEDWVTEIFSQIPNSGLDPVSFEHLTDPFNTEAFFKLYKVMPVKKTNKVTVIWALPPLRKHYKSKPLVYLSSLIGHEGKGSILAYLKKRCWAFTLTAGNDDDGNRLNSTVSLFVVTVVLTESGMDHVEEVVMAIFQYLEMLCRSGPKESFYKELEISCNSYFLFEEQKDAILNVSQIAYDMRYCPPEHYLAGSKLCFEFDPQIITDCLESMKPDRASIAILSSRYTEDDCTEVEKWTKCKYSSCDIPEEWRNKWNEMTENPDLYFPEPNIFLATDFELKHEGELENKFPMKIHEDEISRVWFKGDVKFKIPKAYVHCIFCTPVPYETAETAAMFDLFIEILLVILSEDAYPASMVNLRYGVTPVSQGLVVYVCGFNHKLFLLLETILNHITEFDPTEETFESMKQYLQQCYNNILIKPEKLVKEIENAIFRRDCCWPSTDKSEALKSITKPMLGKFVQECFEAFFLDSFFQGNLTKEEAMAMDTMIREKMNPSAVAEMFPAHIKITNLPDVTSICRVASFNKENQNSVVGNYYQLAPFNLRSSCMLNLLMDLMSEPCYDTLRTKENLGYDVSCDKHAVWGIFGLKINVQCPSNKFGCVWINDRIEDFLSKFLQDVQEMDEEKFETQRDSLIQCKKCDDLCLEDENTRLWNEISMHRYVFDRKEKEIECLENVSLSDFKTWCSEELEHILNKKKLCIQVVGCCDEIIKQRAECELNELENSHEEEAPLNSEVPENSIQQITCFKYLTEPTEDETVCYISNIGDFTKDLPFYLPCTVDA